MTRIARCLVALVLTAGTTLHGGEGSAPSLRRSERAIREWLFREDPLQSSMEEVLETIKRHGWKDFDIDHADGFRDLRTVPPKQTGVKSIRVNLGEYRTLFYIVNVEVGWGFDEAGRLVDIGVWKDAE
jgi:hypothetical protein